MHLADDQANALTGVPRVQKCSSREIPSPALNETGHPFTFRRKK